MYHDGVKISLCCPALVVITHSTKTDWFKGLLLIVAFILVFKASLWSTESDRVEKWHSMSYLLLDFVKSQTTLWPFFKRDIFRFIFCCILLLLKCHLREQASQRCKHYNARIMENCRWGKQQFSPTHPRRVFHPVLQTSPNLVLEGWAPAQLMYWLLN